MVKAENKLTIEDAIAQFKNGQMLIVVDDKNRENEGDFIIAAEQTTPQDINFMMKEGRGLICLAITTEYTSRLNPSSMVAENTAIHQTNFTVSVDAVNNTSTGISAQDRWQTVQVILDNNSKPEDLARPGHMFPLTAKNGGILQRAGHTEAAVDLARLAGLKPASLLVEITDEDGSMARMPELENLAEKHNLPLIAIADLIEYRRKHEKLVEIPE